VVCIARRLGSLIYLIAGETRTASAPFTYGGVSMRLFLIALLLAPITAFAADQAKPAGMTVLNTASFWRVRTVRETVEVVLDSGEIKHGSVQLKKAYDWFRANPKVPILPASRYSVKEAKTVVRLPERTSPDWMKPDFDDSTWVRLRGAILGRSNSEAWKLILMRGTFEVADPAKAPDMKLSLFLRGGAVAYLNGVEVARAFMPQGKLGIYTPAQPYPDEAYFGVEGFVMFRKGRTADDKARIQKRVRRLTDCVIPASKLRKGVNVLAISITRAPTPAKLYAGRPKGYGNLHNDIFWAKIGLFGVRLYASATDVITPNVTATKGRGFLVWNHSIIRKVHPAEFPDPFATLEPVQLTGVRNGLFAGQVVAGDEKPIKGLKAVASDLKGQGTAIPANAVTLRYALPDGAGGSFDSLEPVAPDPVPLHAKTGRSVQPIWINVAVPADAKPGDYAGIITVSAEGVKPVRVALKLRVIDWALPDANDFITRMDIVESPESVALAYGVKMWGKEHLALLDKTFALLKPLAVKTLYVTAIRRTHWGNEHAMVRWVRDKAGNLSPNFDVVDKYLTVATKHLGKVPGVILYCWEPISSMGHAGGAGSASRTTDKPIQYTLLDLKRNKLKKRTGPAWGTPEAKAFWKKFNEGVVPVLKKHGLEKSRLFGLIGDARPTKQAMDDVSTGVKKPLWAVHSHFYCVKWQGYEVGMAIALWGVGCVPMDPSAGRGYGWKNKFWLMYYPREMSMGSTLVEHRTKIESWLGARSRSMGAYSKADGTRGLGRLGADFWTVVKDGRGRLRYSLAGRYPESYWGQLNLNYGIPHLLGKGKDGPVPTVRSEAFRENLQEVEARVFIERVLTDKARRAKLGENLAARCQALIDKRIRMCLHSPGEGQSWFISSDWNKRTEDLFKLASEVTRALAK
jgi:glycosyl hydrolase family 123